MKQYYEYYFYDRSKDMVYPVSAKEVGHDDNLLSLLSTNALSVQAYVGKHGSAPLISLRQSFKSAGSTFEVIDAPTEGVLVPYGKDGEDIITSLCAERSLDRMQGLLRKAQRYSVNLFPRDRDKLAEGRCIHETQDGSGIFYLDKQYYDDNLGVLFDDKNYMEFLNG
jgi:CRISPR-associated endonuclease/helicase Cas3